ncbi:uncharacterized protein LJ206_005219 [Theristicus caerulescens]
MQEAWGGAHRFPGASCCRPQAREGQQQARGGAKPEPLPRQPAGQPTGGKMEPVVESVFCLLQEPGKSCVAEYTGDCISSDNEEERGIPEDLKQEVLPQLPEAHSSDWGAASLQNQQRAACNKPPHQKRGFKKLTLSADGQKPHAEEKPYKCTECGKGFKGSSRLLNHLKTHTREKMFECVECGKSFSRKANLVVHQRVHTGERPYKCKECEKTFSRTSNLISHRKTHAKKESLFLHHVQEKLQWKRSSPPASESPCG